MEHPLNESAWRRGWQDTVRGWKSTYFIVLEAVVAPLLGYCIEWWMGLVMVVSGLLCIWIGATVGAPIKQRNEARALLKIKSKPIPLSNREALLKAIIEVENSAMEYVNSQETGDVVNWMGKPLAGNVMGQAYQRYKVSLQELDKELVVAGEAYALCVLTFIVFVREQVYLRTTKNPLIEEDESIVLGKFEFPAALGEKGKKAILGINEISGQVPDKEGSQA